MLQNLLPEKWYIELLKQQKQNRTSKKTAKSKPVLKTSSKNVEEINEEVILPEKRQEILNELREIL